MDKFSYRCVSSNILSDPHELFWILYFILGASGLTGAYFGPGSGPIHLDYVVCSGTEYNLTDCQSRKATAQSSHSEDVGVKCLTSENYTKNANNMCTQLSLNFPCILMVYMTFSHVPPSYEH